MGFCGRNGHCVLSSISSSSSFTSYYAVPHEENQEELGGV